MNKKQKEAKRKNARLHLKKVRELDVAREARFNSPEYQEQLVNRRKVLDVTFNPAAVITGVPRFPEGLFVDIPEAWKGTLNKMQERNPEVNDVIRSLLPHPLDTFKEIHEALMADPEIVMVMDSISPQSNDDALEGEFEVVKAPIKQLLKTPGSFGYIKHDENK